MEFPFLLLFENGLKRDKCVILVCQKRNIDFWQILVFMRIELYNCSFVP